MAAPQHPIPRELHERLFESYFAETLKADTVARENAERAFAVASAAAAALIAAGAALKITERPLETKVLGLVALATWLLAAFAFMRAVSYSVFPRGPARSEPSSWGDEAIDQALVMRRNVYDRLARANLLSAFAGLCTVIALAVAIIGPSGERKPGRISLTPAGAAHIGQICPGGPSSLDGEVQINTLERNYVVITLSKPTCGGKYLTVRIRRIDVAAVKLR